MELTYSPLGFPSLDGLPIGAGGVLLDGTEFLYKPSLGEVETCAKIFSLSLPKGRYWEAHAVAGTPDYALAMAVGEQLAVIFAYFYYLRKELSIDTTADLITNWEESVGLPDACTLNTSNDLETRRAIVKLFLSRKTFVTVEDFENLVLDLTGFNVKIVPRRSSDSLYNIGLDSAGFDFAFFTTQEANRFTFDVVVDYSLNNASSIGAALLDQALLDDYVPPPTVIECLINRIKPANSVAIYTYNTDLYNSIQ
jgi:uncharacterized protein YmfQ (DUF2313 family)